MYFTRVRRQDPEAPSPLGHIWRPLYCIGYMPENDSWGRSAQQRQDAGYCLDRYSLIDAPKE